MIEKRSEASLIRLAQAGNQAAFIELIQPYHRSIYSLAYRKLRHPQEAEDITQETILRVYSHLNRFRNGHRFSSWIYRIARNLCIDRLRKKQADIHLDSSWGIGSERDWYQRLPVGGPSPEECLLAEEEKNELRRALKRLPANYRSVMHLRYMKQLPLADIGKILRLPVNTVKTRVHRGREALRNQLASSMQA
ncbi:sigma-70 family RNA polymerase sigma factor [Desmospora profundinema]|uniref:RNA polymerase sigma factor n=1 Tax=Desmospora profundinema TaxID=1571184 RepID=A0ABU1ISR7_9BACL|nr:sigma-70 family RNA polymerase sigma factor [Desmospora profundinema]MDR6227602.1 RNA polymerase sigma-70 factor (ECF subfamily) [Desmospora profundinema]